MISIVIPCFDQHDMTTACISAVIFNTSDLFEIVLIDNGSTPPSSIEAVHGHGSVIRNESNTGFPCAVNQGIRAAKGEIIILLNNDVIVTENWAQRLEWHLLKYDIVGPLTNYVAGMQHITIPCYRNEQELNNEAMKWQIANAFCSQDVNWVIGFCMAFKKSLWDEIGPFDESLWPCSGEEIDFCYRARAVGHKVGIARDVYLHHHGSQTFTAMEKAGQVDYAETCKRNDEHLAVKWGPDFWNRQAITDEKT